MERTTNARQSGLKSGVAFIGRYSSLLTAILAASAVWAIFYPANMSFDSIQQYRQAIGFEYSNWHPPLMALTLSAVMYYGGGMPQMMLIQCLAGVLGIRALSMVVIEQLSSEKWSYERTGWMATIVALLLLLPITPTAFFLMTFWKDSWMAILFLWIGAIGCRFFCRCADLSRGAFLSQFFGLTALMIMAGITRHNALIAAPAMGAISCLILARRGWRFSWLALALPAAASVLVEAGIERAYSLTIYHPGDHVKMLDLTAFCLAYPEYGYEAPKVNAALHPENRRYFQMGNVFSLSNPLGPVADDAIWVLGSADHRGELGEEYLHVVRKYPWKMFLLKFKTFCQLYEPANMFCCYYQKGLDANSYGLHQNARFAWTRERMSEIVERSLHFPLTSLLPCHHLWFIIDLIVVIFSFVLFCRRRTMPTAFWLFLTAIPLSYSFSYLAATTGMDYRFLFPSTLFMQATTVSAGFYVGMRIMCEKEETRT